MYHYALFAIKECNQTFADTDKTGRGTVGHFRKHGDGQPMHSEVILMWIWMFENDKPVDFGRLRNERYGRLARERNSAACTLSEC